MINQSQLSSWTCMAKIRLSSTSSVHSRQRPSQATGQTGKVRCSMLSISVPSNLIMDLATVAFSLHKEDGSTPRLITKPLHTVSPRQSTGGEGETIHHSAPQALNFPVLTRANFLTSGNRSYSDRGSGVIGGPRFLRAFYCPCIYCPHSCRASFQICGSELHRVLSHDIVYWPAIE